MTLALTLISLGSLLGFGGFFFTVYNMAKTHKDALQGGDSLFLFLFEGHMKAMVVVGVGGFLIILGLLVGGASLLAHSGLM